MPHGTRLILGPLASQPKGRGPGFVLSLCHPPKPPCVIPIPGSVLPFPLPKAAPLLLPACRAEAPGPDFCSTSAQTQPFPSDGSDRHIQPHGRAGDTPRCPYPCMGLRSPLLGHAAGREAGSCSQLQAQQQQPLLFHTSVFLALLCISVQELKLRSLAEVLSVVTALRAVVRHSLSLSLACSFPLSFLSLFFFSLPPSPKFAAWIHSPCVDTLQLSRQRTKGGRSGSKAWPEPL